MISKEERIRQVRIRKSTHTHEKLPTNLEAEETSLKV
jgi:hypothetical protein